MLKWERLWGDEVMRHMLSLEGGGGGMGMES